MVKCGIRSLALALALSFAVASGAKGFADTALVM
jgi:hypothetical protein